MATYIVELPNDSGMTLLNGITTCTVTAENATDAKAMVESVHGDGGPNWTDAGVTATAISATTIGDAMEGWRMTVEVVGTAFEADVTAGAGDDLDQLATDVAAELVTSGIATAAYNAGTQALTVAGAAANLGDKQVVCNLYPPSGYSAVNGLIASITDEGAAGAALTVTFQADTYVQPVINKAASRLG